MKSNLVRTNEAAKQSWLGQREVAKILNEGNTQEKREDEQKKGRNSGILAREASQKMSSEKS